MKIFSRLFFFATLLASFASCGPRLIASPGYSATSDAWSNGLTKAASDPELIQNAAVFPEGCLVKTVIWEQVSAMTKSCHCQTMDGKTLAWGALDKTDTPVCSKPDDPHYVRNITNIVNPKPSSE